MLREIKTELGFDSIELGHGIRLSLMPGIQKMFDSGQVRSVCGAAFGPGENAADYRSIDQHDESGRALLSRIRTS